MKIRNQFAFLIVGTMLVPFLGMGGLFLLQNLNQSDIADLPSYEEVAAISNSGLTRQDWEITARMLERKPADTSFAVIDDSGKILTSTIPAFAFGDTTGAEQILNYIKANRSTMFFQFFVPREMEKDRITILTQVSRGDRPPSPFDWLVRPAAFLLILLFLFTVTMSVVIARSISESVLILERATKRIAEGEFDLEIENRGSNEITSLAGSLNNMRLALKENNSQRARFIMGVSHDLKTPLALIKGYTEAIQDGVASNATERAASLEIVTTKVDQLEGMIDDLIDFVRVDTGEWQSKLKPTSLAPFLRAYCQRLATDAELLGRQAHSDILIPDELRIPLDERLALRALENLANNALRYTAEGGIVRIRATARGNEAIIEIADNGPGIAVEERERIFEPFYRGSNSRREQGMGLGLSVVKGIVDSHGWTISVDSSEEGGARFTIRIPLAPSRSS